LSRVRTENRFPLFPDAAMSGAWPAADPGV
jgi:hypothetical protein